MTFICDFGTRLVLKPYGLAGPVMSDLKATFVPPLFFRLNSFTVISLP